MFGRWIKRRADGREGDAGGMNRRTLAPSVIASNVNVLGSIISEGVLDIDGQVDGNVRGYCVTIRANGRIRGDVTGEEVIVYGTVDGVIKAHSVAVYATATLKGTILHEYITIEDGAAVEGKLKRLEPAALEALRAELPAPSLPEMDSEHAHDDDAPLTEEENRILENLRLVP